MIAASFRVRSGAAAFLLALAACGEGGEEAPAFVVRDSAGIRIAASVRPAWGEGEGWSVGEVPSLQIVPIRRPVESRLGHRPPLVHRLPDGRIAVGSYGALRLHAPDGTLADTLGLEEDDEEVGWMEAAGDSLLAWTGRRRLLVLAPGTRVARRVQVEGLIYLDPAVRGRLPDGTLLVTEGHQNHVTATTPRRGLVRHLLLGPDGSRRGVFGDLPDGARMRGNDAPFSPRTVVATRGGDVLVGDNRGFEFALYAPDGEVLGIVRRAYTPLRVEPEDVERWHARREGLLGDVPASLLTQVRQERRAARRIPAADTFPAYEQLLVDPGGNVWAEEARSTTEYHAGWSVFAPDGRWLGTVRMPAGFALQQVGADWVLGTEPNAAGSPVVRLYPLRRTVVDTPAP